MNEINQSSFSRWLSGKIGLRIKIENNYQKWPYFFPAHSGIRRAVIRYLREGEKPEQFKDDEPEEDSSDAENGKGEEENGEEYERISQEKGTTGKRKARAGCHSRESFLLFQHERFSEVRIEYPDIRIGDVLRKVSELWDELDEEEKEVRHSLIYLSSLQIW